MTKKQISKMLREIMTDEERISQLIGSNEHYDAEKAKEDFVKFICDSISDAVEQIFKEEPKETARLFFGDDFVDNCPVDIDSFAKNYSIAGDIISYGELATECIKLFTLVPELQEAMESGDRSLMTEAFEDLAYNFIDLTEALLNFIPILGNLFGLFVAPLKELIGIAIDMGTYHDDMNEYVLVYSQYFDHVINSLKSSNGVTDDDDTVIDEMKIIVTGHSKGGNSAQYAALGSYNAAFVDACYKWRK